VTEASWKRPLGYQGPKHRSAVFNDGGRQAERNEPKQEPTNHGTNRMVAESPIERGRIGLSSTLQWRWSTQTVRVIYFQQLRNGEGGGSRTDNPLKLLELAECGWHK
jgi:hypothetical protein